MRRRSRLSRRDITIYRIIFMLVIFVASVIILKGIMALASEDMKNGIKKFGVSMVQSIYLSISSNENHIFSYVSSEETSKDSVFSMMAESVAINHYAMHQGKIIMKEEEFENENFEYEFANEDMMIATQENAIEENNIDTKEDNPITIDSSWLSLLEKENEDALSQNATNQTNEKSDTLIVEYLPGDVEMLPEYVEALKAAEQNESLSNQAISVSNFIKTQYDMEQLTNFDYLLANYYIEDSSTKATKDVFDVEKLLSMDMSIEKSSKGPQILIYHTHASETYIDSKPGVEADTVVGAGDYLTELLEGLGYQVYHDRTAYDRLPNGDSNRNYAYSTALPGIEKILAQNPTIEVVIDLHRDSGPKRVTTINGKDTAQIMLFNGLSRNQSGPIERLENPYRQENLAFSLQTALVGRKLYPGFVHRNYLKNYRYNMHVKERCLLIELGTVNNTVLEAYNAMEPLADVLNQMLSNP